MSFTIQPINQENYITVPNFPLLNSNMIWLRVSAICDATGNTGCVDAITGNTFQFAENDIVIDAVLKGTDIVGGGTLDVAIGPSTTFGGVIGIDILRSTVQQAEEVDTNTVLDIRMSNITTGLFLSVELSAGVTAGNFVGLLLVKRV